MSRGTSRRPRGATLPFMTEAEYRELIDAYVDKARSEFSIAERLAEEARQRFGATIKVPRETE